MTAFFAATGFENVALYSAIALVVIIEILKTAHFFGVFRLKSQKEIDRKRDVIFDVLTDKEFRSNLKKLFERAEQVEGRVKEVHAWTEPLKPPASAQVSPYMCVCAAKGLVPNFPAILQVLDRLDADNAESKKLIKEWAEAWIKTGEITNRLMEALIKKLED